MANPNVDLDQFLQQASGGAPMAASTEEPATSSDPMDIDSFLLSAKQAGFVSDPYAGKAIDPEAPEYANGASPDTPAAAESGVDISDRFALGFGNSEGNLDYLRKKFGAANVVVNKDKETVIKGKDNVWRPVDPNTGEAPDSWSWTQKLQARAKEAVSEIAENIPTAARIASGYAKVGGTVGGAAGAAPTAGASLLAGGVLFGAGAATDIALTSFGRSFGTYKGDEMDQFKDAMFEGALNTLGVVFEAGKKPTLNYLAETGMFNRMKQALGTMTDDTSRLLAPILKFTSGGKITQEAVENVAQYGDELQKIVRRKGNMDYDVFRASMKEESVDFAIEASKDLSTKGKAVIKRAYDNVVADIAEGSFQATHKDVIDPILSKYANDGYVRIAGKTAAETRELLAKQQFKLLPNQSWEMLSQNDLLRLAQNEAELPLALKRAATDSKVYQEIITPFETLLKRRTFAVPTSSKAKAKSIVDLRQELSQLTWDAKSPGTSSVTNAFFSEANKNIDAVLNSSLPKDALKRLTDADAMHKEFVNANDILLQLKDPANQGKADQFLNALFSKGAGGDNKRGALREAAKFLDNYGDKEGADKILEAARQISLRKSAVDFTIPMARIVGPYQSLAAGGALLGASGLAGGSDTVQGTSIAGLGVLALSSPKVGYGLLRTQLKANQAARAIVAGTKTAAERAAVMQPLLTNIVPTGLRVMADQETTRESLMSQIPGANGGQQ